MFLSVVVEFDFMFRFDGWKMMMLLKVKKRIVVVVEVEEDDFM